MFRLLARYLVGKAINVFSSTNVGTGAFVELVSSMGKAATAVQFHNSASVAVIIAFGGSGSEEEKFYVPPGGDSPLLPMAIPKGTRLSMKSTSGTINSGILVANFFG